MTDTDTNNDDMIDIECNMLLEKECEYDIDSIAELIANQNNCYVLSHKILMGDNMHNFICYDNFENIMILFQPYDNDRYRCDCEGEDSTKISYNYDEPTIINIKSITTIGSTTESVHKFIIFNVTDKEKEMFTKYAQEKNITLEDF